MGRSRLAEGLCASGGVISAVSIGGQLHLIGGQNKPRSVVGDAEPVSIAAPSSDIERELRRQLAEALEKLQRQSNQIYSLGAITQEAFGELKDELVLWKSKTEFLEKESSILKKQLDMQSAECSTEIDMKTNEITRLLLRMKQCAATRCLNMSDVLKKNIITETFQLWRSLCPSLRWGYVVQRTLAKCRLRILFRQWKVDTDERKRINRLLLRCTKRWHQSTLAKCFSGWCTVTLAARYQQNLMRRVVLKIRNAKLSQSFETWKNVCSEQRRRAGLLKNSALRWRNRKMASAFESWWQLVEQRRLAKETLQRCLLHWQRKFVAAGFVKWYSVVDMKKTARESATQAAQIMNRLTLSRHFMAWHTIIPVLQRHKHWMLVLGARSRRRRRFTALVAGFSQWKFFFRRSFGENMKERMEATLANQITNNEQLEKRCDFLTSDLECLRERLHYLELDDDLRSVGELRLINSKLLVENERLKSHKKDLQVTLTETARKFVEDKDQRAASALFSDSLSPARSAKKKPSTSSSRPTMPTQQQFLPKNAAASAVYLSPSLRNSNLIMTSGFQENKSEVNGRLNVRLKNKKDSDMDLEVISHPIRDDDVALSSAGLDKLQPHNVYREYRFRKN